MGNSSGKSAFLRTVGDFDARLPYPAQDDSVYQEKLIRSGMYSVYLPEAWAIHDHEFTFLSRCMQVFQAGWSVALLDGDSAYPFARLFSMLRRRWQRLSRADGPVPGPSQPLAPLWRLAFVAFYVAGYLGYVGRLKRT